MPHYCTVQAAKPGMSGYNHRCAVRRAQRAAHQPVHCPSRTTLRHAAACSTHPTRRHQRPVRPPRRPAAPPPAAAACPAAVCRQRQAAGWGLETRRVPPVPRRTTSHLSEAPTACRLAFCHATKLQVTMQLCSPAPTCSRLRSAAAVGASLLSSSSPAAAACKIRAERHQFWAGTRCSTAAPGGSRLQRRTGVRVTQGVPAAHSERWGSSAQQLVCAAFCHERQAARPPHLHSGAPALPAVVAGGRLHVST